MSPFQFFQNCLLFGLECVVSKNGAVIWSGSDIIVMHISKRLRASSLDSLCFEVLREWNGNTCEETEKFLLKCYCNAVLWERIREDCTDPLGS